MQIPKEFSIEPIKVIATKTKKKKISSALKK